MYLVGLIPGPGKPSTSQINHFLRILVDDLLPFWSPGIFMTRTAKFVNGRLIQLALIPLVCDILGAKQVAGFSAHNSTFFCTYCWLPIQNIEDLDRRNWPLRDSTEHRRHASSWRNASTSEERGNLFKLYGVRWSELLRLPYWDPIAFTVLDSMHNLYLGLLKTHCRSIWGMDVEVEDGDRDLPSYRAPPLPSHKDMEKGLFALRMQDSAKLRACTRAVLWYMCFDRDCRRAGTKNQMVASLLEWVKKPGSIVTDDAERTVLRTLQPPEEVNAVLLNKAKLSILGGKTATQLKALKLDTLRSLARGLSLDDKSISPESVVSQLNVLIPPQIATNLVPPPKEAMSTVRDPAEKFGNVVLGRTTLSQIHHDMSITVLPSWVDPAPKDFGLKSRGKLSADQWRTGCTINLVITLIRLWGNSTSRRKEMLKNYMDLVTAVELGTMLTTDGHLIELFDESITKYLVSMKFLYKDAKIQPNHHYVCHMPDLLRSFGPVPAWRAFGFERYNYLLQRINTNMRFGELELTFMRTMSRTSNLRMIMTSQHVETRLEDISKAYRNFMGNERRGSRAHDAGVSSTTEYTLPSRPRDIKLRVLLDNRVRRGLQKALNSSTPANGLPLFTTQFLNISISGILYRPQPLSKGDGYVLYRPNRCQNERCAGRIVQIFSIGKPAVDSDDQKYTEVYIALERLVDLEDSDAALDVYRRFPLAGGRLYYNRYHDFVDVIRPAEIISHFAHTELNIDGIAEKCVHALSLDRVSIFPVIGSR
ncbi:hypothetical protein BV25DRAFT_1873038 [Artomyces pyxidatus]|uniref:Uncharacterized protein n=1 Tax=Artomyces pyxidatus TaxID=48021 RepID=A0ACB8SHM1_9AGAM|nr:hypothetical protein BV25DRAFT_1873038 [Artomyces pyxidatus]